MMIGAADLTPERLPAHPIWAQLASWLTHVTLFPMALTLNLFSALCAAAAVGLLGLILARWLFLAACDPLDGTTQPMRPEDEDLPEGSRAPSPPLPKNPDSAVFEGRVAPVARFGGCVAALAFAFSVPFWSAATRFHFQTFDVLLLLMTVYAALAHFEKPTMLRALMVALLCGLGCVESVIFVPLSPLFFLVLLLSRLRMWKPWKWHMAACLFVAGVGVLAGLLLLRGIRMAGTGGSLAIGTVLVDLLRTHYKLLRHVLPASGWFWILLLAFAPFGVMLLAARRAFSERSPSFIGLHVVITLAMALCLFNAPISPWGLVRNVNYLPVMAYLAVAVVAGYLAAYWRMLGAPLDVPNTVYERPLSRFLNTNGWIGVMISGSLAVGVALAALLNLSAADGRKGGFADTLARDVIKRLGSRTWVVSNGLLDNHLLIAAREEGHNLRLVNLAVGLTGARQRRLHAMIDAEPVLAERRVRYYNAVALGPRAFVQEWLANDPAAESRLLVVGAPEIWTAAGFRPIPDGFGFSGTASLDSLRNADLLTPNRTYWTQMAKLLAPDDSLPAGLARFQALLRREAGVTANNLGVVLEDLERPPEAYEAYEAARRIDPHNLSALMNQYGLAISGTRADASLALARQLKARIRQETKLPPVQVIVRAHGDIRQPRILLQLGLAWSEQGQPVLARAELSRAQTLAPTNSLFTFQLANLAMRQNNAAEGEQSYRAMLAANPNDAAALAGLASVAMARGRNDEARVLLERARTAGAPGSVLTILTAALQTASGQMEEALVRLRALTDGDASNLQAWSLLADLLLRQKNTTEVEQRVLPAMVKAVGKGEHVLVHLVRANLLTAKRPVDFVAARTSLLCALKLRPDLAGIREELLQLDYAFGGLIERELDAVNVLRTTPDHAFANYLLASVLLERGELLQAEDLFRRSLASRPTAMAHNDLAETLRRLKKFKAAEESARAALAINDKAYAVWDTLGCVLLDAGRTDEAAQAVEHALALCATDPYVHLSLARVRVAQGRREEAREILKGPVLTSANLPPDLQREVAAIGKSIAGVR